MEFVGGQAVVEGVLMRGGNKLAIAVRDPFGNIIVKEEIVESYTKKHKILNLPLIRGSVVLFETTVLGLKALNHSANIAVQDEEHKEEKLGFFSILGTIALSILMALFLFKFVPLSIAQLASMYNPSFNNRILFNLTEGLAKIGILIGYIYVISLMADVKRVFQYHGAEHKVVNAWENNDLENAKKYSTLHVRCGTSFILFVVFLSIFVYLFLPVTMNFWAKYGLRILLLPVIAGVGYELIKFSPKYEKNILFKMIIAPGLWLQKLTTREPDEHQIEVAKTALMAVTKKEVVL
jgi:uncharacterized protein YqhQ